MPKLIRLEQGLFLDAVDAWRFVGDDETTGQGEDGVVVSVARLASGERLGAHRLGALLDVSESVETLAPHLDRLELVALAFPKFRDGRALSAATLLRQRWGFTGEVRAVGEVLRDLAFHMVRCGFDAFTPVDGSDAATWGRAAQRHRHVYQRAADDRVPAFVERQA